MAPFLCVPDSDIKLLVKLLQVIDTVVADQPPHQRDAAGDKCDYDFIHGLIPLYAAGIAPTTTVIPDVKFEVLSTQVFIASVDT